MITFTGSPEVGWGIRGQGGAEEGRPRARQQRAGDHRADGDWETAAAKITVAGFSHAGQSCISAQRIYVHRSIADDFVAALVAEVDALVVGDPLDEATDVSALISARRDRAGAGLDRRGRRRRRQGGWSAARSATTACCGPRS